MSFTIFNGPRYMIERQNARIEADTQELAHLDSQNRTAGLVQKQLEAIQRRMELVQWSSSTEAWSLIE